MQLINKIKNKINFFFWGLLSQLVFISNAKADLGLAAPSSSDMSRQFINQIFGSLLDGGADAFGASIATFNGGILTVGGVLVAYTILAGTLGTAHDGEMMGKKFSSVWVPIRTAMGTALVLPVMSGGYCVMQAIVMWLIMQGVSLGNTIWSSYMSNPPALAGKTYLGTPENIKRFVQDVYLIQVCFEASKKAVAERPPILGTVSYQMTKPDATTWQWGDAGGYITNKNACGTVKAPKKPETRVASSATTSLSSLNGLNTVFKSPDLDPIYQIHLNQITTIINGTNAIAKKAIDPAQTATVSELDTIATAYATALSTAGTGAMATSGIAATVNQQGWFLAGSWVTQLIFLQNKIDSAINSLSTASPYILQSDDADADQATRYATNGYRILAEIRPDVAPYATANVGKTDKKTNQQIGVSGKIIQAVTSWATGIDLENIKSDNRHPLVLMNQIGNSILSAVFDGLLASLVLAGASAVKVAGTGVDFTPAFIAVFGTLAFPLMGFIGVGGMLAYILPNTPFLLWLGIIIGWTILVIEAIIAAPLWAVMHLHPNGDDLTGKGANGYMLVLGLLLRPALIIFGLIASIVLSELFGKFVNLVFFDMFSSNTMDGGLGFFGMLFGTSLYATIMFMVIKNTFSLMHIIPDQLMRWIGGGGEQLGQYANQISEGAVQKGHAVAGTAAGLATSEVLKGASSSYNSMNQLKETAKGKEAQQEGNKIAKQGQIQDTKGKMDQNLGSGSSAIVSQALGEQIGQSGESNIDPQQYNGFQAQSIQSSISGANEALGGTNSAGAQAYRENVQSAMAGGMSFDDAHKQSLAGALDSTYGEGASKFLGESSKTADSPSGTFSGSGMARGVEQLSAVREMYRKLPPSEQQAAVSTAISSAFKMSKRSGGDINAGMNAAISTIHQNSTRIDKSAIAAPVAAEPIVKNDACGS